MTHINSGNDFFNEFLEGGYEKDIITTIYGPSGSGKTCLCLITIPDVIKSGKKVIYIDTEGGFSVTRLKQICDNDLEVLDNVLMFSPTNFEEQKEIFKNLKEHITDKIGLIIVDSISMLYRLRDAKNEIIEANRELGIQLAYLMEIARKYQIPVIITNQVYSSFENKDQVNMVGGDLLKYTSKCLIELKKLKNNNRIAILKRHRSIAENKEQNFKIINKGIEN